MKTILKRFFYGILVGISNLIPGFSGGTMALILGIYEEFTNSIANIVKKPKESIKYLWSIGLGIVVGIVGMTYFISLALKYYPIITASFFVGLVIATIPLTLKNINKRCSVSSIISFIICATLSVLLPFSSKVGIVISLDSKNIFIIIIVMIIAAIASATMIIPAASGSMILLAFGMFDSIIELLKNTFNALLSLDMPTFLSNLVIIIPFGIGVILGIFLISKAISYLFKHHDLIVWYGILGLLVSAIFTIFYNAYSTNVVPNKAILYDHLALNIVLSIIAFCVAFVGLTLLMKYASRIKEENKESLAA